ncbi:MAG: superoxide dismutase [Caulobacteraceae bacterium]|nr:superoxide dismutase [Caulobacter sp.]
MASFILPDLPYDYGALAPTVSETTMRTHHDKHHATYVKTVNDLLSEAGESPSDLESVVRSSQGGGAKQKLFNNAAQAWNHGFFWNMMSPSGGQPSGKLADAIDKFGGLGSLKEKLVTAGTGQFGSGWAWAQAKSDGSIEIYATANGDSGLLRDGAPFLGVDVWEHAYYLDYKQDRKSYLEGWFDKLINWDFAGQQFEAATGGGQGYRFPAPQA